VLALVCGLFLVGEATKDRPEGEFKLDIFDHIECITYDARVRMAASFSEMAPISTNIATLFIDDEAVKRLNRGDYIPYLAPAWDGDVSGLRFGYPWPRFVYGQFVRELKAQGATAVGFDILFPEVQPRMPDYAVPILDTTNYLGSDGFFAQELETASNVVLATQGTIVPNTSFKNRAAGIGNIFSESDYGVLRRVRAFGEYQVWHPEIESRIDALNLIAEEAFKTNVWVTNVTSVVAADKTTNVTEVKIQKTVLRFPKYKTPQEVVDNADPEPFDAPIDAKGNLKLDKDGSLKTPDDPDEPTDKTAPPSSMKRAWNLGITLAAIQLGLDLENAKVESDRIIISGKNGVTRTIPTDRTNRFFIDWSLRWDEIKKDKTPVVQGKPLELLMADATRFKDKGFPTNSFENKIVVIGSVATGNNVSDVGVTPLEEKTFLVTKHLNVANSILTDRFIKKASDAATLGWVIGFGILAALLTWSTNVVHASVRIAVVAMLYVVAAFVVYVSNRYWLPIVMPVFGGLLLPHFSLVTYRVVFEQKEQRHIKGVFQRLVSPEVVNELLGMPNLTLGGERRDITVYFADVRGFTEFTDTAAAAAEEYVKRNKLSKADAEAYYDLQAKETLETVNLYLGIISDQIKKHKGTLDKYIGDCVMAFWGAPLSEAQHALYAVRAAVDSQQAMHACNQERAKQNEQIKIENEARVARGEEPLRLHPLLSLGSGINSGVCIVGMMGSQKHVTSYTVFGREVNLASRLEGVSGRGRIIVSVRTYEDIKKIEPEFAATFVELEAVKVKGIRDAVRIFEVPWRLPETPEPLAASSASASPPKEPVPAAPTASAPKPA